MGTQTINNLLLRAPTKEVCWWRKCVTWDCFQLRWPSKPEWSWWRDFTRSLDGLHIRIVVTWFLLNSIKYRRTRFDLLRPEVADVVFSNYATQKLKYNTVNRDFYVGEWVMVRNLRPGLQWIPGT